MIIEATDYPIQASITYKLDLFGTNRIGNDLKEFLAIYDTLKAAAIIVRPIRVTLSGLCWSIKPFGIKNGSLITLLKMKLTHDNVNFYSIESGILLM